MNVLLNIVEFIVSFYLKSCDVERCEAVSLVYRVFRKLKKMFSTFVLGKSFISD